MTLIIGLILLGMFLLVVEILLLPGVTIAGIGALGACGFAIYYAFDKFGNAGGLLALAAVLILTNIVGVICLRARTWRKLALNNNIDSTSQQVPDQKLSVGDRGTTISRLAPMGKIVVAGETYEAKSLDSYIDQKKEIEVTGFENFTVIVRAVKEGM